MRGSLLLSRIGHQLKSLSSSSSSSNSNHCHHRRHCRHRVTASLTYCANYATLESSIQLRQVNEVYFTIATIAQSVSHAVMQRVAKFG